MTAKEVAGILCDLVHADGRFRLDADPSDDDTTCWIVGPAAKRFLLSIDGPCVRPDAAAEAAEDAAG